MEGALQGPSPAPQLLLPIPGPPEGTAVATPLSSPQLPPCSCASLGSKPWPHWVWEERRLGLLPVPAAGGFLQQVALWADGPAKAAAVGVPLPWAGEAQSWAALKPQKEMAQIIFCEATKGDGNAVGCGRALEEQTGTYLLPRSWCPRVRARCCPPEPGPAGQ